MSSDTTKEALVLVNLLKCKLVIATAVVMIKNARAEEMPSSQYASDFQKRYFSQNYEKISPELKQNFLGHCHDNVLKTFRKTIPVSNKPGRINQHSKAVSNKGGDLDFIDLLCMSEEEEEVDMRIIKRAQPSSTLKPKDTFRSENSSIESIKFVQAMMYLIEESEKDSPVSTNLLESLLCKDSEQMSDFNFDSLYSDSGIGTCSDSLTEVSRCSSVSSGVVKYVIESTKTKQLVLISVKFVTDHLKLRIEKDVESVFQNWEGSEVQFMNRVLCKCCNVSAGCRKSTMSFIYSVLDGIWHDQRLQQNRPWELKTYIVNEFINHVEICKEVNQYIVEKVNYFIERYAEKPKKQPEFPAITEKLFHYLNLFSDVCDTLAKLKSDNSTQNSPKDILSENYMPLPWQEQLFPEEKEESEDDFEVSECEIQSLERLAIITTGRHPLIAALAHELIVKARHLTNTGSSQSQMDYECSFSFT